MAIGKNVNELKSYWQSAALDYTWSALTRLLAWLNVDVWQWSERDMDLRTLHTCPELRRVDADAETLAVLCSGRLAAPHNDLLVARGGPEV